MAEPLLKEAYTVPELARLWGIEPGRVRLHLQRARLEVPGRGERITVAALDAALPEIMAGARYIAARHPARAR